MEQANPVLVNVTRGGVNESFHRGVICVVNEEGKVIYSQGDICQVCYPRSALKYFQHLPLLLSGAFDHFGFSSEELAIMCGSHNGEAEHLRVVSGILAKIGLDDSYLQCGAQPPSQKNDYLALIRSGQEPGQLHNNCSGKHSGFLAYCRYHNLPLENYLSPEHPLHREILKITALFHSVAESDIITGLDGCSAPIFALPVYNQALAYMRLGNPAGFDTEIQKACSRITEAVTRHPFMVAGSKRYCTDLMAVAGSKIVGKTGADGVYSISLPERRIGITIKVDDGRMGPQYNIAQQLLKESGILSAEEAAQLDSYIRVAQKNYAGNLTGYMEINTGISYRF